MNSVPRIIREAADGVKELKAELARYRQALTRAVSLPMGQLPHGQGYCSVMINGEVVVKPDKKY